MNELFYTELSRISEDISHIKEGDEKDLKKKHVLLIFRSIIETSSRIRKEGLSPAEVSVMMKISGSDHKYLPEMLDMLAEDMTPDLFEDICMTRYYSEGYTGYEALIFLISMRGVMAISQSDNPYVVEDKLIAMLPEDIRKEYEDSASEDGNMAGLYDKRIIEKQCEGELPFKPSDRGYIVAKLADCAIRGMDDTSVRVLLEYIDRKDLLICMRGMSGVARKKIFDNQSSRLSLMIADDMEHCEPVAVTEVVSELDKLVGTMTRLMDNGIVGYQESEALNLIYEIYCGETEDITEKKMQLKEIFNEYSAGGRMI